MKAFMPRIGLAVTGLCVGVGCPQLKNDDFLPVSVSAGGGGTTGGTHAVAAGGASGAGSACEAGSGGCGADAGDGGSAGTPAQADGGADAEPEPAACGLDEVLGPTGDCYFADRQTRSWSDARTSCQSRGVGWDLVVISDADENAFVQSSAGFEAWIGATDATTEGTWSWLDEALPFFEVGAATDATRFTNWSEDEPNDYDDSDCLRMLTTGLWADWPCDSPLGHVCRRHMP
jgi:hypothetical protein